MIGSPVAASVAEEKGTFLVLARQVIDSEDVPASISPDVDRARQPALASSP